MRFIECFAAGSSHYYYDGRGGELLFWFIVIMSIIHFIRHFDDFIDEYFKIRSNLK